MQITNKINISFQFKLRYFWLGWQWQHKLDYTHIWLCLIPCLVIHFKIKSKIYNRRYGKAELLKAIKGINSRVYGPALLDDIDYHLWRLMLLPQGIRAKDDFIKKYYVSSKEFSELRYFSTLCNGWYYISYDKKSLRYISIKEWNKIVNEYSEMKRNEMIQICGDRVINRKVVEMDGSTE